MTQTDLQWMEEHLQREATEYLENAAATPEERQDILEWVRDGNSVHSNPWYMADENGCPMDYLTAMRLLPELAALH